MKKLVLASLMTIIAVAGANASDGGVYMETSNMYSGTAQYTRVTNTYVAPRTTARRVVVGHRPCGCGRAAAAPMNPVAVKTHTEVIDHYQVYQPVVEYVPAGTYTTRRTVSRIRPCDM